MHCCRKFLNALIIYWKTLFVLIVPFALLPVFLFNNIPAMRCMYVVLLMACFWMFEALPLAVTSLIPMVFFPLMGIMDADKTSMCYMKETTMMFIGGFIIAIAVEYCNLHTRIALYVIQCMGCSPRRLNLGLVTVTMLVSMWISNTAATAMMIPIIEATLKELEAQGIGEMYVGNLERISKGQQIEQVKEEGAADERRPTNSTICYFLSTAYAATIGGMGTLVGSGTNLTFKGNYETEYDRSPGVDFVKWMALNIPMMLVMMYLTVIWMQLLFMGLFRPSSNDAQKIRIGAEGEKFARSVIREKIVEMGPMSFHESAVAVFFVATALLWFFRKPQFIPGWAELITDMKVKDATAAFIVVFLLFIVPSNPNFIYMFSDNDEKRPTEASQALLTWKVVQQKMHWSLIFLLGGGFAIADGSKVSGMSDLIADTLKSIVDLPNIAVLFISCSVAIVFTQFSGSNVAVLNVLFPVLVAICKMNKIHPMYIMMPTSLACSFAYCLPASTPPNGIAAAPCNMRTIDMVKAGLGVVVICVAVLFAIFPFLGPLLWDLDKYPDWVN